MNTTPSKSLVKKIFSKIFFILISFVLLVLIAIIFFNIQRLFRENQTQTSALPSNGHLVQTSDSKIFVQEVGASTSPAVLLIHGTGTWSGIWKDTIPVLASKGFHVIAIDLPPFGYSYKPIGASSYTREKQAKRIIEVIKVLGVKDVTLVGHSVGARPTLEAALIDQNQSLHLIHEVVLVDPALGFQASSTENAHFVQNIPTEIIRQIFSHHAIRNALISTYGTNPLFIKSLLSSFVYNKAALTEERVKIVQLPMTVKGTTEAYGDWLENLMLSQDNSLGNNFDNFKNIKFPVKIIWGEKDTTTPIWQGEALNKLIPESSLFVIKDAGHIPYIEKVDEFNSLLVSILKK